MKKSKFSEEQIVRILQGAASGKPPSGWAGQVSAGRQPPKPELTVPASPLHLPEAAAGGPVECPERRRVRE